jgi:serine/threonine protein kinase
VLGTVGYMAPEQVRGLPVDQRADLFAFGAILYELLSGVRAFSRETAPETVAAILNLDPPDLSPMRFQISPIVEFGGSGNFGLSPDGRQLAFVGLGADGIARLWIRAMDSLEVRPLPGSEAVGPATPPPFWSPDGRFVAFDAGGNLKKLDVSGGLPQTLCDLPPRECRRGRLVEP